MKKLILHSGGMDSTAIMLDYVDQFGAENVISLGFNYGQRHFARENDAAKQFCKARKIKRVVLKVPIDQIGGSSLIDKKIDVTTDMKDQRSTVVPQRNAIFCLFAAAFAQENDCDTIVHGACVDDYPAYRDCRKDFFRLLEAAIQAGRTKPKKGNEYIDKDLYVNRSVNGKDLLPLSKLDIKIDTPLIFETKSETVERILQTNDVKVYKESYTCYNGVHPSCGKCPACVERLAAFEANKVVDPIDYKLKDIFT